MERVLYFVKASGDDLRWMSDLPVGLRRVADAAEGIKHREPKALVLPCRAKMVRFCETIVVETRT